MESLFLTRVLDALRSGGDEVLFVQEGVETGYAQAFDLVRRMYAGLPEGGVVAIDAGNRPETVLLQLAAQLRGATVLLVAASASSPDRLAAVEAAGVTTLVTERPSDWPDGDARVITLDELTDRDGADPDGLPESVTVVFPTGGTTGTPKLIRHSGIYDGMAHIFAPDPAGPGRTLLIAPMTHMTGNATVLGAILRRESVVLLRGFDAGTVLDAIAEHRITALSLTPARLAAVLDHPAMASTDVGSVRQLSLGAAPLPPRRLAQALEVFGPVVGQGYGLTEAPMIASISAAELDGRPERLESVGRIVPGMEARIDDGEVLVRGLSMMVGYHGAAPIGDGWLRTGDLGRFDHEGYLYLLDRANDVIITGEHGTKVYSTVVENALARHPLIRSAAVFGVPGDGGEGERVHAVVVASGALSADEVRAYAREFFGREHFVPSDVDFAGALPLTAIGKVDKRALREPFWAGHRRHIA
ncbi:class I adenylate-forming enzyme family protein [Amycolatopsis roodepoortensis]|uniref:Acyl-CoA synthetase (AMP-forming)/AMP-acid ligase II n=1 Tax=Amycolatopsis roodepoortensis TaxID=700274 RepID=A0ABR9L9D3_9PSEU|nr:AMP-binding protein [Amycolatopsis roodepoortensis]MBE1577304.1 acyl-CoA synthetase (AMP-forming)/AMP-acid ligase II [Amycolatopsis roodepoortensis]